MAKYGILSRSKNTYTTEDKTGKQPYYWNQGIGRIRAIPLVIEEALFDATFDDTFN